MSGKGTDKLTDSALSSLCEERLRSAMGAPGSKIVTDRLRNLAAYLAEPEGEWAPPEVADRSNLVATDVADTVEWLLPSLLRVLSASKDAIEVTASRPQFEAQAHVVRETLHWVWWERLNGLTILHDWLKDGLMSKVGFLRIGYCADEQTTTESYRGLPEGELQQLLVDEGVTVTGKQQRQEQTDDGPITVYDVDIERAYVEGYPTCETVPPEEMRIDSAARYDSEPHFIAQVYERPRSELGAQGYKVAGMSGGYRGLTESQEEMARRGINSSTMRDQGDEYDPMLLVEDCYVRRGSAHAPRWIRCLRIDGELVERDDDLDAHPFGWWCPAPLPHVFFGNCPADFAIEPQRLRTNLLRALEDNVYLTVNGRIGIVGGDETTISDVLDSRPGGIVRLKRPDDLVPIAQPDLSESAWNAVEWAEQWTEKRTGFSRLSKGLSSEALNDTATGVMEITERADMRAELIARHAAEALGKVLRKIMRVMARHQDVPQQVRIAGQWAPVDPREWDTQYQVRVRCGLGTANKDRQIAQLQQLAAVQGGMIQAGMIPPPAAIALARKLAEAMGQQQPETFFPDFQPQPPAPPPQVQVKQMELQADAQRFQAEAQQKVQELQLQHDAKIAELRANLELQATNDERDAAREQQRVVLEGQIKQMEAAHAERLNQAKLELDKYKADLDAQTKLAIANLSAPPQIDVTPLQNRIGELETALSAPVEILRDPKTGRVSGVNKGGVVRQIRRGPDGRAIGVQ